ncbi:MAG: hypothetical protein MUO26_11385 [Methanotrichaceae archaeon]|nr:hypothetical protein [Methanotrichaceae archaeon]
MQCSGEEINKPIRAAVHAAMENDLFRSINFAALKARAGHLEPGETLSIGGYEFLLAEDEEGEGIVVLIVITRQHFENLASDLTKSLGLNLEDRAVKERNEWLRIFMEELRKDLQKWQQIWMRFGLGDDLTFEKAVYRRGR